jgi:alcohol dehydrogenase class IV
VTERALGIARDSRADGIVAIGGGAAIGLSKALALRTDLAQIVAPSTYAGSEVTPVLGETRDGFKTTQSGPRILPEVVVYDVDLTLDLPAQVTSTSGINAMAHAIEALYAPEVSPIISRFALDAIRVLARALPVAVAHPNDFAARTDALYGAWLCGTCLASVGMALHHKLCHTLGGAFDLPHAATHAVILPHVLAYNGPMIPEALTMVAEVLGTRDPADALYELVGTLGAERSLKTLGMPEGEIDHATDLALQNPYWNPRPLERDGIRRLIARAWAGDLLSSSGGESAIGKGHLPTGAKVGSLDQKGLATTRKMMIPARTGASAASANDKAPLPLPARINRAHRPWNAESSRTSTILAVNQPWPQAPISDARIRPRIHTMIIAGVLSARKTSR